MRKVISVFLPQWPMELRQRRLARAWQPDKAFVIAAQEGRQNIVVAVNNIAAARGIAPGMTLSRARVVEPELISAPATPEADKRALDHLTVRALRYSPLVAACAPDGLWIDATGVTHLFGGDAAMVRRIGKALRATGFTARTAMAPTPGAAWAWSHYGSGDPVLTKTEILDSLPLPALRLSHTTTHALRNVGVKTIGALRRLPRATIPMRFGPDVLRRLDQAFGLSAESITPILPPTAKRRSISFAEPIATPEDLRRVIVRLTEQLCADLDKSQEGARKLDLVFGRADGGNEIIRIGTARPSREVTHLAKLLAEKLPTVDPGFGIETATLTAWRVGPLHSTQLMTDGESGADAQELGELVDRLANRIGARNVFKIAHVASDIPERAVAAIHPLRATASAWPLAWPRPVRMFAPPEPVHVIALLPDYPPAKFRWRAETHTVRIADGPERIFGEWWKGREDVGELRDYFRVENDRGERYWLFRTGRYGEEQRWFMHGVFA